MQPSAYPGLATVGIVATDRDGAEHAIQGQAGRSLMQTLKHTGGLDVEAICGGSCACGTCHVLVEPEWFARLPKPGIDEIELIQDDPAFVPGSSRLSCQILLDESLAGIRVTLAPTL